MESLTNTIGLIGVACIMLAYALMTTSRWHVRHMGYLWLNLAGTLAILCSLCFAFNWPGFALNIVWAAITLRSIWRVRAGR